MRVLGIDTSLRSTGFGVVEQKGNSLRAVEFGTLRSPASATLSNCLTNLHSGISEVLARCNPDVASIEGVFFCKNLKTAVILGQARGAVLAACALGNLSIYEYAPRKIKQAVVGFGGADKSQVARMIASLLALDAPPQEDAADALAIAICHIHSNSSCAELMPKPI